MDWPPHKLLYKALQDVKTSLQVLPSVVPEEFFSKYPAFPMPRTVYLRMLVMMMRLMWHLQGMPGTGARQKQSEK
eukprot:4356237-Ditylum_brightwellii.AAC.1